MTTKNNPESREKTKEDLKGIAAEKAGIPSTPVPAEPAPQKPALQPDEDKPLPIEEDGKAEEKQEGEELPADEESEEEKELSEKEAEAVAQLEAIEKKFGKGAIIAHNPLSNANTVFTAQTWGQMSAKDKEEWKEVVTIPPEVKELLKRRKNLKG